MTNTVDRSICEATFELQYFDSRTYERNLFSYNAVGLKELLKVIDVTMMIDQIKVIHVYSSTESSSFLTETLQCNSSSV